MKLSFFFFFYIDRATFQEYLNDIINIYIFISLYTNTYIINY